MADNCEFCGEVNPGEICRCRWTKRKREQDEPEHIYDKGRSAREQYWARRALRTGWTGTDNDWAEFLNRKCGRITGEGRNSNEQFDVGDAGDTQDDPREDAVGI